MKRERPKHKSRNPRGLTRRLFETYPELKQRAINLVASGYTAGAVSFKIGVSQRIVDYWVKNNIPEREKVTYDTLEAVARNVDIALRELESRPAPTTLKEQRQPVS